MEAANEEGLKPVFLINKKVKRECSSPSTPNEGLSSSKKIYHTFDSSKRSLILNDLKKACLAASKNEGNLSSDDLLDWLKNIPLTEYNNFLKEILTKHTTHFQDTTTGLTRWRRKIKGWIKSMDKPETRGGQVVPYNNNAEFKKKLLPILRNMKFRCFPVLRREMNRIVEEIRTNGQEFVWTKPSDQKNSCSKHWWFNFIRRNPDIKEIWENLPLERSLKKRKANQVNVKEEETNHGTHNPSQDDTTIKHETNNEILVQNHSISLGSKSFSEGLTRHDPIIIKKDLQNIDVSLYWQFAAEALRSHLLALSNNIAMKQEEEETQIKEEQIVKEEETKIKEEQTKVKEEN